MKQVRAATKAATSLTADLTLNEVAINRDANARGTVRLKKPNLALIDIGAPFDMIISSDGKKMLLYMKQADLYRQAVPDGSGVKIKALWAQQITLFFTAGESDDVGMEGLKFSNATFAGTEKRDGIQYQVLELVSETKGHLKFRLYVAPNKLITGLTCEYSQANQTIKLDSFLHNVKVNSAIPNAVFAYKPPKTASLQKRWKGDE